MKESFREKMARFMSGRYGMDELYKALLGLCLVLVIVGLFIRQPVLTFVLWAIMFLAIFRSYSRNIEKRTRENETYLRLTKPVRSKAKLTVRRIREGKNYRFRTCPSCKAAIRMPRKKGRRTIICPKCGTSFGTRILF